MSRSAPAKTRVLEVVQLIVHPSACGNGTGLGLLAIRDGAGPCRWPICQVRYRSPGVGGGAGVQNESYLFDLVGNVTQRQNNNLGLTENFYYDNLHRLDYSTLGGNTNLDLAYDALGNITSRSDVAGGATWTYHATKRHAVTQAGSSSYTYSYDANGNAITRNGDSISWSSSNYPTVINGPGKQLTFSYDANRQRIQQVYANGSTTQTTAYVGGLLEKVTGCVGMVPDLAYWPFGTAQDLADGQYAKSGTEAPQVSNFRSLDPRQQAALVNSKWPSDIARQQEQLDILRGLLGGP